MKVSVESPKPCRKVVTVELPLEQVQKAYDQVLQTSAKYAQVPGFRQGRAPASLVESHYKRVIREDAQDRLVSESYKKALEKADIKPVLILDLEVDLKKNQPLTYKLTVDVPPEFKLPRYKNIAVKQQPTEVTDEMVDASVREILNYYATYEETEDLPIRQDDIAVIDLETEIGGQPLVAEPKQRLITQGTEIMCMVNEREAFLPGTHEQLEGLKKDDEKTFELDVPEDFHLIEAAGKTVQCKVKVQKVRRKQPAVLDEELLKKLEVDDETELRSKIRERIQTEQNQRSEQAQKDEIVKYLVAKTSIDIPESQAQEETMRAYQSLARRFMLQGVGADFIRENQDDIYKTAESTAIERVKVSYILHNIAQEEKIEVEEAEINEVIKTLAARSNVSEEKMRNQLKEKQQLDAVRQEKLAEKTLDFLLANAKIGEEGFLSRIMGGGHKADTQEKTETEPTPAS